MEENFDLEALFDAVIVKPIEHEDETYGDIIVPDLGKEKNETGIVVASGPGKNSFNGFVENTLREGDKVILPTMGFTKLEYKGEEYYIGKENEILAKIK